MCRSKHVEPSINFGIINSITKLHLVGISTESSAMHGFMNIKRYIFYDPEATYRQQIFKTYANSHKVTFLDIKKKQNRREEIPEPHSYITAMINKSLDWEAHDIWINHKYVYELCMKYDTHSRKLQTWSTEELPRSFRKT